MHEKCDFNEKGRVFMFYLHLKTKTLEKFQEENNKIGLDWISQRRTMKKLLKRFEKCGTSERKTFLKSSQFEFQSVKNQI